MDMIARIADALHGKRTGFAVLAETSRCLADSLDFQSTLETVAGLALPQFGSWCMVDVVESEGSIRRVAVIHPDPAKQKAAREYYAAHPPCKDDPIGAPRVIRTSESEFVVVASSDSLADLADPEHRNLLRELGATSFLMVPMRARGRTLGAITFVSDAQRKYDDADLLLAEDLGRRCAMALDNARLYRESHDARVSAEEASALAEAAREDAAFAAQRSDALRASAEALHAAAEAAREEAETANKSKEALLATVSHEFRTPLGIVLGYVDLLNEEIAGPINDGQRKQIQRIGTASRHLLQLIEEILTISQVNAGHGEVRWEDVDLSALLREAAALLAPMAEAKGLTLPVHLPEKPIVFSTDPGKFRQIVFNLAANAVKFTKKGEVRLSLQEEDDTLILRVSDTGIGISPADAERLFESYWQVRQPGRRQATGTGLGLSITRQLAQLLGGDVTMESSPGRGSTFTVRLPRSAPDAAVKRFSSVGAPSERRRRLEVAKSREEASIGGGAA